MSNVAIERTTEANQAPSSVIERMESVLDRIRRRAYDLFQSRGATHGSAMDDWLQAEQALLVFAEPELIEKGGKFNIRVPIPGFSADEIRVTAMPDALIIEAGTSQQQTAKDYTESAEKQMFQRLELPAPIDPDKVTASLEDGLLQLVAEKAGQAEKSAQASVG